MKGLDERIYKDVLQWFGHVESRENYRIAKSLYVRGCTGSCSMGRLWRRWIDTVKDCLKNKKKRFGCQASKENGAWWGFVGCSPGDEPLTLTRCHSCGLPRESM